ncbi:MAG: hypothetical protein H0V37_08345, partial [Chloroflexia bacterium]|nr:hypothetical protein [Chloroflexia bacterium]
MCGFVNTPAGTPTSQQTAGDCRKNVCDGSGAVTSVPDDADRPEDNNGCTTDSCLNGVPSHTPKLEGTACGDGGGAVCDATGTCVGCLTASDCPGSDTECQTRSCNGGICGAEFAPQGTPTSDQTSGDCKQNVCDGAGGVILIADNTDVPGDDGNQCTTDTCVDGVPTFAPVAAGSQCSQGG